jgi:hypothetical protein
LHIKAPFRQVRSRVLMSVQKIWINIIKPYIILLYVYAAIQGEKNVFIVSHFI